jgi:hypothetical protein
MHSRNPRLLAFLLATAVVFAASTSTGAAVSVPGKCRTNPDTLAIVVQGVMLQLTLGDSADLVSAGIPFNPDTVRPVLADSTCAVLLASLNGLLTPAESGLRIDSAYVVAADYAYALVGAMSPGATIDYNYFDSTFAFKFALTDLH